MPSAVGPAGSSTTCPRLASREYCRPTVAGDMEITDSMGNAFGYCQKVEGARFTPAALRASSSAVAVPVVIKSPLPVKYRFPQLVAPRSATRMPKQFMSLLSGGCRGIVAGVFRAGTRASCGRFLATAMPMGTELPEDFSSSETFGEGASILTRVVRVEEDMVFEEAVIEAEDRP